TRLPETVVVAVLAAVAARQRPLRLTVTEPVRVAVGIDEVALAGVELEVVVSVLERVLDAVLVEVRSRAFVDAGVEQKRQERTDHTDYRQRSELRSHSPRLSLPCTRISRT